MYAGLACPGISVIWLIELAKTQILHFTTHLQNSTLIMLNWVWQWISVCTYPSQIYATSFEWGFDNGDGMFVVVEAFVVYHTHNLSVLVLDKHCGPIYHSRASESFLSIVFAYFLFEVNHIVMTANWLGLCCKLYLVPWPEPMQPESMKYNWLIPVWGYEES